MKTVNRLYPAFTPSHYALHLEPRKTTKRFSGTVTITGELTAQKATGITLHGYELAVLSARLVHGNAEVSVESVEIRKEQDEIVLHAAEPLARGTYTIELSFSGRITDPMNGLYPCYFKAGARKKQLLATQFESHHAREVFPCIDEPAAKATFDLTLVAPKDEEVVANTPIKKRAVAGQNATITFETTPKMSTYLLAFVVGELGYKEQATKDGVLIRTWATKDNVQHTDFALEVAVRCLEFYNDYFKIPYPLKKCDLIALPDFASGAMENWGCITFRESCMLVDAHNTAIATKQFVAMVVAHELAHQWFGNLVTMEWWNDLWLNEGFASWIEYLAVDHLFPEWHMWTQFVTDDYLRAQSLDSLQHSHPVEVPVPDPDQIRSIFDAISYSKGASVIRMLHAYLGATAFRDGLSHYLNTYKYGNASTQNLWSALEETSGKPVARFMDAWTGQTGFPMVSAHIRDGEIRLSQSRYVINPRHRAKQSSGAVWPIPVSSTHTSAQHTLAAASDTWPTKTTPNKPIKLNRDQTGFYLVAYEASHIDRLAAAVRDGSLSAIDRLGVLNEAFQLAKAGFSETTNALRLLEAYREESNAAVWELIASQLGSLRKVMQTDDIYAALEPLLRTISARQVARLGWEPGPEDSHFDRLLRPLALEVASLGKEPAVVQKALELFDALKNPSDIHADLRTVVYHTAARERGKEAHNKLLALYKASTSGEERINLASGLTAFRQLALIKQNLRFIQSEHVKLQDVGYWIAYSFANRHARVYAWEWLQASWSWLLDNFKHDMSFSRLPNYAAHGFSDESFVQEYTTFFKSVPTPGLERSIAQGKETIEWQAAWKARDYDSILAFLKTKQDA